jgi:hypothetical protein
MTGLSTTTINYSDGIGSRSRRPFLLFIRGEEVIGFRGENIPGVMVVRGTDYTKNGKWSQTTYRLELADGFRHISGRDGWETGRFVEGLRSAVGGSAIDTWADVANALGVSVPAAMTFLRSWRPEAAEALDKVDEALSELDDAAVAADAESDTQTVVVSFGSPTRRARADGFWTNPKAIPGGGELRLIDAEKGWTLENVAVHGITGKVLSTTHASGHGGGYVSVTVAVLPGTEVAVESTPSPSTNEVSAPVSQPASNGFGTLAAALQKAKIR